MSITNVETFLHKLETDSALQAKAGKVLDAQMDGVLKLAAEAGTPFTLDEYHRVVKGVSGELSDAQLDRVSGGQKPYSTKFLCRDLSVRSLGSGL